MPTIETTATDDRPSSPSSRKRILSIEDNPGDARLLRERLRDGLLLPYVWLWVERLTEGLEHLEDADLVLLDLSLPDAIGLDGFRAIRDARPDIPIVVVTGQSDQDLAIQATQEGAQDYLVKGRFDADTLGRVVRMATERQRLMSALKDSAQRLRKTGEQVRRSQEQLRQMIECNADGMLVLNEKGSVQFANRAALALLGRESGELIGTELSDVVPGETDERSILTPGGETRAIELRTVGFEWDGAPAALTTIRDVTLRHRAEEVLRESEERYRLLFDNNPQAMWVCEAETGSFLAVNEAAINRYGYSRSELLQMQLRQIQAGAGSRPPSLHATEQQQQRTKDGRWLTVEVTSGLVTQRGQKAVLMLMNDVTQSLKLETELRQAQKMDAIGRLAGGIAHDFNNILMAIGGYATMAARRAGTAGSAPRELDQILASVDRAATLVRQLLAFGRRQVLQPTVLDLNLIASDLQPMLRRLIPENIQLTVRSELGQARIKADHAQIEQVIVNLVVNARDAMAEGGILTVETRRPTPEERSSLPRSHLDRDYLVLSVRDTGTGISPEAQAHIFEPFFTTKPLGHGTGLGLSTVFGIVKQSGGEISFETEVGHGTAFHIFFPETEQPREAPAGAAVAPAADRPRTGTILLVEDDPMLREIMLDALESSGYSVLVASDGADALRRFESSPIDVLVTDLTMPVMGGRELARRLREARPDLNVLFLSGYSGDAIVANGIVLDSHSAFLEKPVRVNDLIEAIQKLRKASSRRDPQAGGQP